MIEKYLNRILNFNNNYIFLGEDTDDSDVTQKCLENYISNCEEQIKLAKQYLKEKYNVV
jgi:hypothetical protein